ncbi:hypothetical protein [Nocardia panacis]|uniref:hypothetical protein n=1 Tax=Nocardia panacis TaxID=2340916 RepID=UPI001396AB86|nr:hypothetical protein [Nocardia panacis]
MAKVTIEGVINSDVCGRGDRYTVEWTERLRGLVESRVVQIVRWHHDEVPPAPAPKRRSRAKASE